MECVADPLFVTAATCPKPLKKGDAHRRAEPNSATSGTRIIASLLVERLKNPAGSRPQNCMVDPVPPIGGALGANSAIPWV